MHNTEEELKQWGDALSQFHLPRWNELPEIELYMEQLVTIIEKYLDILLNNDNNKIITPAMINNYVKLKLIPPPVKKRYNKTHIAYLIAITILKQVITITEVKNGIIFKSNIIGARDAFNLFCDEQEASLEAVVAQVRNSDTKQILHEQIDTENLALKMATLSFACKILAEKTIQLQNDESNIKIID